MPIIYILLPVHNRKKITLNFIDSLVQQNFSDYHLVLIDDGSIDGTSEAVKRKLSNLTILKGNGSLWWAGALQKGIKFLKRLKIKNDDIVLFINDDTYMPNNFLKTGMDIILGYTKVIAKANVLCMSSKNILERGVSFHNKSLTFKDSDEDNQANMSSSNGLFLKWEYILQIGDFKPLFLPHYLSDYEYTHRAHCLGYKIIDPPELILFWDQELSGYRSFRQNTILENLEMYFSKKSAKNPIYWSIFIALTTSGYYRIKHLKKIWLSSVKDIICILRKRTIKQK